MSFYIHCYIWNRVNWISSLFQVVDWFKKRNVSFTLYQINLTLDSSFFKYRNSWATKCMNYFLSYLVNCSYFTVLLNNGQKWQTRHGECNFPFARNIITLRLNLVSSVWEKPRFSLMCLFYIALFRKLSISMTRYIIQYSFMYLNVI